MKTNSRDDAERLAEIREFVSPADTVTDRVFLLRLIDERDATIAAKDAEIADLRAENERLKAVLSDIADGKGKCSPPDVMLQLGRGEFHEAFGTLLQKIARESLTPPQESRVWRTLR